MRFEEYRQHDGISLAGLIAKRQVSVEEVLEAAIARAEQVNPAINAIVHRQYEQARKSVAAGLPEGPLKGVPYLIKDLGFFQTGEPATFGSSLFKDFVAHHDTAYVTRCKKAGLRATCGFGDVYKTGMMALVPQIIQPTAMEGVDLLKGIRDFEGMTIAEFYTNFENNLGLLPNYVREVSKDLEDIKDFYNLSFAEFRAGKTKSDRIFRIREY